jgi:transposase InsO family protein
MEDEAVVVAFRRHTLLPLDDCLYALQPTIPHLTRSSLHRCLQRHGISRLPETGRDKPRRAKFKRYPIGYFHIDIAEVQTAEGSHSFELACAQNNIEHRRTLPRHPWTIGQVERMNRTIKEATVRRFHYGSHDQLRTHLADFLAAYNFARRLKTLHGLTPYEAICKAWAD